MENQSSANYFSEPDNTDIYNLSYVPYSNYTLRKEQIQDMPVEGLLWDDLAMDEQLNYDAMAMLSFAGPSDPASFIDSQYTPLPIDYIPQETNFSSTFIPELDVDVSTLPLSPQTMGIPMQQFHCWNDFSNLYPASEGSYLGNSPCTPYYGSSTSSSSSPTSSSSPLSPPTTTFPCTMCEKVFPQRHLLNRHVKTHVKPASCPEPGCDTRSATARDLQRHIDAHHPDSAHAQAKPRPLCPVEGCRMSIEGFSRPDHLRRHMTKIHPDLS